MSDTSSLYGEDAGSGPAGTDEWGSAVTSGDATKLAKLVLLWSGSKPERALSILRDCVSLLEKEVAFSAPAFAAVPSPPTMPGPSRSSCVNAVIVALNETCDGKSWYTSTKELQLTSLEFCIACRTFQTLHLKVDAQIPRRLLATTDAPPPHPKRLCPMRVPRLRTLSAMWNMPTAAELGIPICAMTDVDYLEFGNVFEGRLEGVAWPRRLETIEFHHSSPFNQPVNLVEWPASLQQLTLGGNFNQPIEGVKFPPSLQTLKFGFEFNQPIEHVSWPDSLQLLAFGVEFNQPIEAVVWPPSLHHLVIGDAFNQPVERATFPASLIHLTFGSAFDQAIDGTLWPDSLECLVFGDKFNQPIGNVRWPASLRDITFGWWNAVGDNGILIFSQFNQRIGSSTWPLSLRQLTLGDKFRQSLNRLGTWMPNLETLVLLDYDSGADSLLRGIEWPKGLHRLGLFQDSNVDGVEIPSTVEVMHAFNHSRGD